jgi:hypothetical protein
VRCRSSSPRPARPSRSDRRALVRGAARLIATGEVAAFFTTSRRPLQHRRQPLLVRDARPRGPPRSAIASSTAQGVRAFACSSACGRRVCERRTDRDAKRSGRRRACAMARVAICDASRVRARSVRSDNDAPDAPATFEQRRGAPARATASPRSCGTLLPGSREMRGFDEPFTSIPQTAKRGDPLGGADSRRSASTGDRRLVRRRVQRWSLGRIQRCVSSPPEHAGGAMLSQTRSNQIVATVMVWLLPVIEPCSSPPRPA